MEQTDEQLVAAHIGGERKAFEGLMLRYEARIYGLVRRMCGNPEDAREVTQDAFLSAFRSIGVFRGDSKFSTWLYRIAINACLKKKRKLGGPERELSLDDLKPSQEELASAGQAPDWRREAECEATRQKLRDALERIPEQYRTVILLRDFDGLSTEEAAAALGVTETNLKVRLHRGRLALRREFLKSFPQEAVP